MTKKMLATWGILIVLLVSLFGTASAQTGVLPGDTPEPGAKFFTHPVVKLLSTYFDREGGPLAVVPDPLAPVVEGEESGLGPIGEAIAEYHEDGMGFGVLVKIYAMAEASAEACAKQAPVTPAADGPVVEACTPITAVELVTAFQSGMGMGQLYKEYGIRPTMMGVGHVKHAVDAMGTTDGTTTDTTKGGKPDKTQPNNGKGQGKGPNK